MIKRNELEGLRRKFEDEDAEAILEWALDKFHPKIALASSFSAEDVVLIDMLCKVHGNPRIFTIDTGRLPQETYILIDRVRDRYGVTIEVYFPRTGDVEAMVRNHGPNLFYRDLDSRILCCNVRKVEPLTRALKSLEAWITGLRRGQAPSREGIAKIELDQDHGGLVKINPIADWSTEQVWTYIVENKVPYNELYDKGYSSIGCAPCTRPIGPGEDERAGRWWWEVDAVKECGLHHRFKVRT
ncbi:MAG: phosphoadenylyl-sulfate reductase [Candidatus Bathyarchaeia archaeon]|nr:phosphoadenylyl-sulfate reductase [Candidatus Bathyarchaeota archaeon]